MATPPVPSPSDFPLEYLAESTQTSLRVLDIAITILAVGVVAVRMYVRRYMSTGIALDDWLILASTVLLLIFAGLSLLMIQNGVGRHIVAIEQSDTVVILQGLLGCDMVYNTSITLTKVSILLMYCRMLPVQSVKVAAYIFGSMSVMLGIAAVFTTLFQCTPIEKEWLPNIHGHCIDGISFFIAQAALNIFTDISILMLPMPHVWKLHISIIRKIYVSAIFLLGSFVVFISIYRLVLFFVFDPSDFSWTIAGPSTWTVVETGAAIISASLPTLGPLLKLVRFKLGTQTISSSSQTKGPTIRNISPAPVGGASSPTAAAPEAIFENDVELGTFEESGVGSKAFGEKSC